MTKTELYTEANRLMGGARIIEDSADFTGFFQRFRPDGQGLDSLFAKFRFGEEVFANVRRVYGVCRIGTEGTNVDSYFIVRSPLRITDAETRSLAEKCLEGLVAMADLAQDAEAYAYLRSCDITEAGKGAIAPADYQNEYSMLVHEFFTDWLFSLDSAEESAIEFREAFYSMTADYFHAAALMWLWYRQSTGLLAPLRPYLELWESGHKLLFRHGELVVFTSDLPAAD
jgi:hypothetical protein